jgi:hypothetical protein
MARRTRKADGSLDGRTALGRTRRRGYAAGFAGQAIDPAERQVDTWPTYEDAYARGRIDKDKSQRISADLAAMSGN